MTTEAWQDTVARKRAAREAAIPKEWRLPTLPAASVKNVMDVPYTSGIMSKRELELTEMDAFGLCELLQKGAVKSYDVTLAFCKRAAIAHQLVNCLTVVFFDLGLERAKEMDAYFEKEGKPIGPYHGLPISLKDCYDLTPLPTSSGYVSLADKVPSQDGHLTSILLAQGAVFYCKTGVPQALMHFESENNLWGRVDNPYNRLLSPGGSSGGEGALVAFRGSVLGIGGDIGGSVRGPAGACGIYGFKPETKRVPGCGPWAGKESIRPTIGPITRSARDLEQFFANVFSTAPWLVDEALFPIPWRSVTLAKKIKIGYFIDDGVLRPHPPIYRAMEHVISILKQHPDQFDVVPYEPLDHGVGGDIVRGLYFQDGGKSIRDILAESGEPEHPLTTWVLDPEYVTAMTVEEVWALNIKRDAFRTRYLKHWLASGVDAVLCPSMFSTAMRHGTSKGWYYTAIWNMLDYPAVAFPSGLFTDAKADPVDTSYTPRDNKWDDKFTYGLYDPEVYAGAPIGLQLVGRRWGDEELMQILLRVDAVVQGGRDLVRATLDSD